MVSKNLLEEARKLIEDIVNDCSNSGQSGSAGDFSSETARESLLSLKGDKEYVFAILDIEGNAYLTAKEWSDAGAKAILGIGYTEGKTFLCMHINEVGAAEFGGNGTLFGSKVCTTTAQWEQPVEGVASAMNDFGGASNTEGIIGGCKDSLAEKCKRVEFANGQHGYMPASGELRVFCRHLGEVDAIIRDLGGDPLKTKKEAELLFSSTCRNSTTVWCVKYVNSGDAMPAFREKAAAYPTRVFVKI